MLGSKVGVFLTRNIPQEICFQIKMWEFKGGIRLYHNKEVGALPGLKLNTSNIYFLSE